MKCSFVISYGIGWKYRPIWVSVSVTKIVVSVVHYPSSCRRSLWTTPKSTFLDYLLPSSCKRSLWTSPKGDMVSLFSFSRKYTPHWHFLVVFWTIIGLRHFFSPGTWSLVTNPWSKVFYFDVIEAMMKSNSWDCRSIFKSAPS